MSPPLTLGPAGWAVARARRVPFVFNIQDVFPDVAVELGLLTGARAIAAASLLERVSYRRSDAVTVLSDELADNIRTKITKGLSGDRAARRSGEGAGHPELRRHHLDRARAHRATPTATSTASATAPS